MLFQTIQAKRSNTRCTCGGKQSTQRKHVKHKPATKCNDKHEHIGSHTTRRTHPLPHHPSTHHNHAPIPIPTQVYITKNITKSFRYHQYHRKNKETNTTINNSFTKTMNGEAQGATSEERGNNDTHGSTSWCTRRQTAGSAQYMRGVRSCIGGINQP